MPGDAEDFSSGSGSWSSEGSYWGGGGNGEVQSNSNSAPLNGKTTVFYRGSEQPRPPLLRSSRGCLQMLPSRFSDSVLVTWKNRGIKTEEGDSSLQVEKNFLEFERTGISAEGFVRLEKSDSHELKSSVVKVDERLCDDSSSIGRRSLKTESNTSGLSFEGVDQKPNGNVGKRKEIYKPEDFALGDIVWVKCGKRYPAWPAVVIDPILEAPKSVLSCCVPGALCVMFFGYSKNGTQRDYAWVKQGMIFPFLEFMDRFQGQTQLYRSKPSDFRMALEEAMLAEDGILESQLGPEEVTNVKAHSNGLTEATVVDQEYYCQNQLQETEVKRDYGEVFKSRNSIQTLDKTISNLEMELAAARAAQESIRSGAPVPKITYLMVVGINIAFSRRKRRDSVRATWMPTGEKRKKLEEEKGIVMRFVIGHRRYPGQSY